MGAEQQAEARFLDALPWYVNGTLETSSRRWMDDYLASRPEARAALQRYRELSAAVLDAPTAAPADLGWDDFAERHGLKQPTAAPGRRTSAGRPWARWFAWVQHPAVAGVAAAVMLCQTVVIAMMWHAPQAAGEGAVRSQVPAASSEPVLQVRFKADASEIEIRRLLLRVDGHLVGGPSQIGDYLVGVPADRLAAARQLLADSPLVQDVGIR